MRDVKIIGFDLDQTLYPKSPKIDEAIQEYIYRTISEIKNCTRDEGRRLFCEYYPKVSGRNALIALGIPGAEKIINSALENADIASFLQPNKAVEGLLIALKNKYGSLTLITGSSRDVCAKKLVALEISQALFECIITGEVSKSDGSAFKEWFSFFRKKNEGLIATDFLYIGDRVATDVEIPNKLGMRSILVNVKEKDPTVSVIQLASFTDLAEILL